VAYGEIQTSSSPFLIQKAAPPVKMAGSPLRLRWSQSGFGALPYAATMRWVIPGTLLAALGFQTVLSSFLLSVLGLRRR